MNRYIFHLSIGATFLESPSEMLGGTDNEHAKAYLADPSGNVIELKAYRNVQSALGLAEDPVVTSAY
jgi:extradiol dioxygenase family protein